jgi:VWFA-related protein
MSRLFRVLLVLFLSALGFISAQDTSSQQPVVTESPKAQPVAPGTSVDRQVLLDVRVTDKSGAPVRGLQQQDFTILDDKLPLPIASFQAVNHDAAAATDPPVEVILVVDAVNASFQAVNFARSEVKKFLLENGGKLPLPVSLVFFTDRETKVQPDSSRDGNALAALYQQYETGLRSITRSAGIYGASERFSLSIKTITQLAAYEATRPGRKLMIWFSPGWPMLSGPRIQLSEKDQQHIFESIVQLSTGLRQARVTLYSMDPLGLADAGGLRVSYYEEFLKGIGMASRATAGNLALQVLATQSGGRAIHSGNDLTSEIEKCAAEADSYYILSISAPRADKTNEYHSLAVSVGKPGVTARTRTGYYAQP